MQPSLLNFKSRPLSIDWTLPLPNMVSQDKICTWKQLFWANYKFFHCICFLMLLSCEDVFFTNGFNGLLHFYDNPYSYDISHVIAVSSL